MPIIKHCMSFDDVFLCRICAEDVPNGCSVYVGFDPTAESLHTGNLMAMMTLLHFNRAGYQPIAVVSTIHAVIMLQYAFEYLAISLKHDVCYYFMLFMSGRLAINCISIIL